MRGFPRFLAIVCVLFFLAPSASGETIDVMVVYDSTAESWAAGHGGMNTFAADAVARMNQATANSNIDLTFRLVHVAEVSYAYSGDLSTDLNNLQTGSGSLAVVHQWRDDYGADLVALLVDTGSASGTAGYGYILSDSDGQPDYGFSVSNIRSVDISHTLTHEVGHNLGCNHSKYQAQFPGPNTALNTYSAGWYFTGTDAVPYHTIMAYGSDGYGNTYTEAPLFSTPLKTYQGTVAGHAADGDNARNIRETMGVVAAYRSYVSLPVDSASYSAAAATGSITVAAPVGLAWTATSNAAWITITSDSSGTGNGTVSYSVSANATGSVRVGTVDIEGNTFTVTQSGGIDDIWLPKSNFRGAARNAAVGFSIGTKGYIGTGWDGSTKMKDFWEYDPAANTWTQKADFGGTVRFYAVGFSIGSKGYIGTGWDGSTYKKDFWEYNPTTNSWTKKTDFGGTARGLAVGFSIGIRGYIGTGFDGSSYRKDFWEYDPAGNAWTKMADFGGTARMYAVGFSVGSKGYVGTGSDGSNKKDFWEYDPAVDAWTRRADFGGTERYYAVGFSVGTRGYIGTGSDGSAKKDFWEYDPVANAWTRRADFGGMARYQSVGFSIGTRGYIGTGWDGSTNKKDFWEYTPGVAADLTPPTGSVSVNGGAAYTASPAVTLSISATDAGSGVAQMCLSNSASCSAWEPYATTKGWTLPSGDGTKTVYVRFRDGAGNANTTPYSDGIILDTTPPTGSVSVNGGAAYTASPAVTLSISATDAGSGVAQMCLSNTASCSAWETYTTTKSWTLPSEDGTKTVYVRFRDGAGSANASPYSDSIVLDTVSPTGSVSVNGGAAYTASPAVTLSISATDAGSGVAQMCVSNAASCSAWETYAATKSWTLPSGDGTKTVYIRFRDGAGNANGSPYSDSIVLDGTAPVGGALTATPGDGKVSLAWSGFSDAVSGIANYRLVFSMSGIPSSSCSSGTSVYSGLNTSYTHASLSNGSPYYYRVCATNSAGVTSSGATASAVPQKASGSVAVDAEPGAVGASAPWTLSGPNGYNLNGQGDRTIAGLDIGNYTLTWGALTGWSKPVPSSETLTLNAGGRITFVGGYHLMGNLNGDVSVTLADAILAMQVMSGVQTTVTVNRSGDVNGDGKIGLPELIYILQKVAGMR